MRFLFVLAVCMVAAAVATPANAPRKPPQFGGLQPPPQAQQSSENQPESAENKPTVCPGAQGGSSGSSPEAEKSSEGQTENETEEPKAADPMSASKAKPTKRF